MLSFILFILFLCSFPQDSFADEDPFLEYQKDIETPANAKAYNVYNAYADNMAALIKSGYRDGIVIENSDPNIKYVIPSEGIGNVKVEKGANLPTLINQTQIKNSTVIFKNDKNGIP